MSFQKQKPSTEETSVKPTSTEETSVKATSTEATSTEAQRSKATSSKAQRSKTKNPLYIPKNCCICGDKFNFNTRSDEDSRDCCSSKCYANR